MTIDGTTKDKSVVYSLSAPREFIANLDHAAAKMGWSRAELVRQLAEKYLGLVVNDRDFSERIDQAAEKAGTTPAQLIETLVNKHLNLIVNDTDEIPIILWVPSKLRDDSESLKSWLDARMDFVFRKLNNGNS